MAEHSRPTTLFKQPTATIYLDGLMVLCYNKRQKRLQAGIHTQVGFHALTIKVRERGQGIDLHTVTLEHEHIKEIAPLFLYVEKTEGSGKPNGAATLYKPDDPSYTQAFANVLDMQSEPFHKHDHLRIMPNILAPLNILNGEFYAATLGRARRINLEGKSNPFNLGHVSTMVAGDISSASGELILRSNDHKAGPLIHLSLSNEKHYEVFIFNEPANSAEAGADHSHNHSGNEMPENSRLPINHFNIYYQAFDLKDGAMKYTVEIEEDHGSIVPTTVQFPPCDIVRAGDITELPEWS